ncbi:MAG TPA: C25 family cysteine peptidase [Candidatus Dormibacteraeota bacterium]|nr:C25 family cysteine peptidase [Candidatus Dormibacteraeota bacterium]
MIDGGADSKVFADSKLFEEVVRPLLEQGMSVRFQARGASMSPAIRDGEVVEVTPVIVAKLRKDDIVLAKSNCGFRLHRIVRADSASDVFITRGDCGQENDPALRADQILGLARAKEVRVGRNIVQARFRGVGGWMLRSAARAQSVSSKLFRKAATTASLLAILGLLFLAASLSAQVAVDATTSANNEFTGTGTFALNFTHTTTATANRLLVVGVSMNITNSTTTGVVGVTYNGTALNFIGAHNDAGATRRVEMWYLLNPASGANRPIVVSVQVPTAGATVGVVAGATTFTDVDQTVPLGTFTSADGAAGANSQMDVPSVINGMILDTMATGGDQTVTVSGPQVSQWNITTVSGTDPPAVTATGSSRTGAPSVPISEVFSGTSNWSLGAIPINPSTADIGVSTSVSAVALGANSTFNITITNSGPSAANGVTLTDTYAAAGLAVVSVTPSAGTTCVTGATITCTLPTPFASGAVATVAVVVSTTTAGFYPNTATITDSGTPPDPNTGNNTYVALAPVVSVVCAANTLTAGGTLTGVVNTYFPGNGTVAAGATSIPVGASRGAGGTIAAGSLLLIIQMQDASISTSNTVAYGNGSTGAGFTTINNAGNYEWVTATGPVAGGNVPISGAGTGGGLVFGYTNAVANATKGISTFQVVLVPQYTSATLGAVTASAWNGRTGGILALDIAGQLNLGSATVSLDGLGFRGGAGMQLNGNAAGANTDYRFPGPNNYTGAVEAGVDAPKGEGVAGTSKFVESGGSFLRTINGVGYPSGTAGTDGSMARGAPGNAGGGGTDADPAANDQNAGGGGGGNGGSGGFGGDSWNTNLSDGGEGGGAFPATIDRVAMGGGGGAGTRNNSDGDNQASSAAAGGGIIFMRADTFSGTATLTANGASAYNGTLNDAGGGGGAGGTIVMLAANGGEAGLTLQANGGNGGNAWQIRAYTLTLRHGPGGGGGGGVVFVSGAPAGISVAGGANGLTLNTPAVPYGATAGNAGTSATNATLGQVTGIQSSSLCTPDMTLGKSHVGNFTRGSAASYTIPVSNVSPFGATTGLVTINDTLPLGISPTSAIGTGWTCSVSGQTLSCTRSDVLAAASSYPSITLNALVAQSAPATLTNTATVSGGGEANLANDTATDVANVGSTADMAVTDAGSPNPVTAGSNITYTVVVTNNGPSAADNATLVAPVPANTTFVSLTAPAGWGCLTPTVGNTGNVVCTNSNLAGLTSGTFTFVVKVNAGVTNGTVITGTATVSSSVLDPNLANNTATVTTMVGTAGPNLSVTNVASPNPVQAGNNITYTQVVTNTGSSAIANGTFTEATPANTTFVSITPPAGWSCALFPASPCTNASVAAGSSGTFTVVYKVIAGTAAGTVITDTATVNATNQSFGANSATATDVVATAVQADVALSTAATPNPVIAGNAITYTQTISNNGPAAATGVSFTEATPTNTTFQSVLAPAGWTCTTPAVGATGTITCNDTASLASGTAADIVVALNVPSSVANGTAITATSTVSATTSDPNSANNSTTVVTSVNVACDLSVTNSGSPSPVTAGSNITYTQIVTNLGPSNCSTGTLTEATPLNTTFVSVAAVTTGGGTWTCPNTGPVSCTNPSVPPGSTGTITAIYKVTAGTAAGTIITDTVNVATTSHDTNLVNNSATVNIAVASGAQADLSVTNSGSPNPVTAGNNITYTQSVTNAGPGPANAPVFTETLPANTSSVSLTGPAGWTCVLATLTCTDTAAMGSGTTANFTFVVKVTSTVAQGTIITQTDSVTSTTPDPNGGNNSATVNTVVADSADLAVTNTPAPVPVLANANITYTQVVTNNGPSTATSVSLTETAPANTTGVSLTGPAGWTCTLATLTCTDPSLAPAAPATITYVVKVNVGTAAGTAINETASVTSAITDPNSANNSATAADVVALATQADLIATNSAAPTSVAAGSNVTYTQTVTNNGPAAATAASFTQVTPPNTNFQSITPPAGWTCGTVPPMGGTGTITCTDPSLGVNATASFTLVLQVNSGTPSGTNITDTVTANATNIVPSLTTNTASATVVVANANSADMAIVKTATPNPVTEGTPLTYSLAVTNNGPASATNVTVTDTLPSTVTFLSSTSTQGSCSEAGGTVTCLLGTMANAGTATVTILTIPQQPGVISNTATVTADQTDPNLGNNTSTQSETVVAPTRITLRSFSAHYGTDKSGANRVLLTWKTGGEAHNLGFNVYRDLGGNRARMNSSLIAGSALLMSGALPRHAGRSYAWIDPAAPVAGASYWLEDIDVNGTRTLHGPVPVMSGSASANTTVAEARMFNQMSQAQPPVPGGHESHMVETLPLSSAPTPAQVGRQFELASHPAVKIQVRHEGWYRVTQPELVKAGLDPNVDPALLHLYAEAIEQPIQITGANNGPGGFGPQASISFYGTGINTVFSGTRVYWLVAGEGRGARIPHLQASAGSNLPPTSYSATVELQQHSIYFAALLTTNGENFFGSLVSSVPVDETLEVPHMDTTSTQTAQLEISLQGVIVGFPHDVLVALNKTNLGDVTFTGQDKGTLTVTIPAGVLQPWSNTVTLTAQNGDYDTSLVEYIRITYPHRYVADADQLKFTGHPGEELVVSNFTTAPAVIDVTDPNRPVQLTPLITSKDGKFEAAVQVPFTTTNPAAPVRHVLLAVADDRISTVSGAWPNHPSHWHASQPGADIAMVTYGQFAGALAPLVRAHEAEGKTSAVIPVGDLYDEFNFGERSPVAIKQFLQTATQKWRKPPAYLLLNGRASFDPRNYLGFGNLDMVPTFIVPTTSLMTASDDWFSDFTNSGAATIATGRLPVSTIDEATTVIGKISTYEGQSTNGPWTANALFVADKDDTENFTQDSLTVEAQLPAAMQVTDVFVDTVGTTAARGDIINAINSGQGLVNYLGHGSEQQWSGPDIFDETTVNSLTNGSQLPVFLIMDCLNGYFQDVYAEPLGATLMLAPNGGAVAVLASSGLNQAPPQTNLDAMVVHNALSVKGLTLGGALLKAKSKIADADTRRTFVLLGDPAMLVKQPSASTPVH